MLRGRSDDGVGVVLTGKAAKSFTVIGYRLPPDLTKYIKADTRVPEIDLLRTSLAAPTGAPGERHVLTLSRSRSPIFRCHLLSSCLRSISPRSPNTFGLSTVQMHPLEGFEEKYNPVPMALKSSCSAAQQAHVYAEICLSHMFAKCASSV